MRLGPEQRGYCVARDGNEHGVVDYSVKAHATEAKRTKELCWLACEEQAMLGLTGCAWNE